MDSSEVLQLLAHSIKHPKVVDFFAQYKLKYIPESGERGQFAYQNSEKTLQLTFWACAPKSFREYHMQPVIDRYGNYLELEENGCGPVFTKVEFNSEFKDRLPFNLSFDMDEAAITKMMQVAPAEIISPCTTDKFFIDFWVSHIKYHRAPYLLDVAYRDGRVYWFEIALADSWQVEQLGLQAQYPGYIEPSLKELSERAWAKTQMDEYLAGQNA